MDEQVCLSKVILSDLSAPKYQFAQSEGLVELFLLQFGLYQIKLGWRVCHMRSRDKWD